MYFIIFMITYNGLIQHKCKTAWFFNGFKKKIVLTRQINFYAEGELNMVLLICLLIETEINYLLK